MFKLAILPGWSSNRLIATPKGLFRHRHLGFSLQSQSEKMLLHRLLGLLP